MRTKPSLGYVGTACFLAICLGLLVGYPAAAVTAEPGFAARDSVWFGFAFVIAITLSVYSAVPKSDALLGANFIVLPSIALIVLAICYFVNPKAVGGNVGQVIFFSIFTIGAPFWLPLIAWVMHLLSCTTRREKPAPLNP